MKVVTIKTSVNLVAQIAANVDHKVIVHEGRVYADLGDFTSLLGAQPVEDPEETSAAPVKTKAPAAAPAKRTPAKPAEAEEPAAPAKPVRASRAKPAKEVAAPAGDKTAEEIESEVVGILGDLDQAEINDKKAGDLIIALGSDVSDTKAIRGLISEFVSDPSADMADVATAITAAVLGEAPAEEAAPAKPARATKSKAAVKKVEPEPEPEEPADDNSEGTAVEIGDLEEGDEVAVWFESMEEWYTGKVLKVSKKSGTIVKYDEDQEEVVLDPEEHTEIIRY